MGQQKIGTVDDGPRDCNTLLLAPGELSRHMVHPRTETNLFEHSACPCRPQRLISIVLLTWALHSSVVAQR